MAEVWADPYFGQGDKVKLLVALSIADCARSEDGKAWPSIESIARKSRTSVRGAQEAVREMEKAGKLAIEEGIGPHGTNVYLLLTPPHAAHPARGAPRKRAPEKAPEFPAEKAALVCTQSIRNGKEPSGTGRIVTNLSASPAGVRGDHERFIELWTSAYPEHHNGEAYAFQGGKDGAAVKSLLTTSKKTPDQLLTMAIAAWNHPAGFHSKLAASICGFNSKFNEIRNELNGLRPRGSGIQERIIPNIIEHPDDL